MPAYGMRLAGTVACESAMNVFPDDAAALERRRVAVIVELAGLAAEDAVEGRPHAVYAALDRVARRAVLVELFATCGVAAGTRRAGREPTCDAADRDRWLPHLRATHSGRA